MSEWIDTATVKAFVAEQTDAYRLCTFDDGWVERFGSDVLISHKIEAARERLRNELAIWSLANAFKFTRIFARFLPKKNAERVAPQLVVGDGQSNLQTVASERFLRYGIDFESGYSVGLFPDQRENRSYVLNAKPRTLLNCFAYTCAFSVAAAHAGAKTVNVDLSKKSLARGQENFALNSLLTDGHRFLADDVMEVLPRLARKGEKFDGIILDPPTFSRSHKGKAFQVEQDFEKLLSFAIEIADRDAHILLSTNCTSLNEHALEVMAKFCLKLSRRAGNLHRQPCPKDFPPNTAASTVWLTLR
ncbi:MAG: class I SAM-dependent methyltransferase [Verrucomicrobiota bacterium]|nr:class I SAM-dependent methyltransferase [Verrucomicrobiota bacterium]